MARPTSTSGRPRNDTLADRGSDRGSMSSIYEYLQRLEAIGEDPQDYESIWYYY